LFSQWLQRISLLQNGNFLRRSRLRNAPHHLALFITVPSIHSSLRLKELYEVDMSAQIARVFDFWTHPEVFFLLQGEFRVAVFLTGFFGAILPFHDLSSQFDLGYSKR